MRGMKSIIGIVTVALIGFAFIPKLSNENTTISKKIDTVEGISFETLSFEKAKAVAKETGKIMSTISY